MGKKTVHITNIPLTLKWDYLKDLHEKDTELKLKLKQCFDNRYLVCVFCHSCSLTLTFLSKMIMIKVEKVALHFLEINPGLILLKLIFIF